MVLSFDLTRVFHSVAVVSSKGAQSFCLLAVGIHTWQEKKAHNKKDTLPERRPSPPKWHFVASKDNFMENQGHVKKNSDAGNKDNKIHLQCCVYLFFTPACFFHVLHDTGNFLCFSSRFWRIYFDFLKKRGQRREKNNQKAVRQHERNGGKPITRRAARSSADRIESFGTWELTAAQRDCRDATHPTRAPSDCCRC